MSKPRDMQGEGNYEAAKRFNQEQTKFAKSGKVERAAAEAEPKSEAEAKEMARAEAIGRGRAKQQDESVERDNGAPKNQNVDPNSEAPKTIRRKSINKRP
jgi:hypothetical protein